MPFVKSLIVLLLVPACLALAEEPAEASRKEMDVPIPIGMPMKGLKIPHHDEEGKQSLLFESDVATKINEDIIEFENLKIEALDDEGRKIFVEVPQSVFNLETRILSGDQSAKIHREDFEINGDSIEFDTRKKFCRMRGNITMVIHSANNEK